MKAKDPNQPEAGEECPNCDGEIRDGHLIDAERVDRIKGDDYTRRLELADTRIVYCPDCWNFWTVPR